MTSKLRTAAWYLQRPRLYQTFAQKVLANVRTAIRPAAATREVEESRRWCRSLCRETSDALIELGIAHDAEPFEEKFVEEIADSRRRQESSPVKMGGAANLNLLFQLAHFVDATRVIETGVAYGWSALALLLCMKERAGSLLVSTDMPYAKANSEDHVGCVVPETLRQGWQIIRKPDRQGLPEALERLPTIDLCHYDSDKSLQGRRWAYRLLWRALRPGGVFVSDDISDNLGFREFSEEVGCDPMVVRTPGSNGDKFVGVMIKPGESR